MKMDKCYYFKSNSGRVGIVTLLLLLSVVMLPAFSNVVYGEQSAPLAYPLINDSEGTGKIIPASGYVVEFTYGENQYVLDGDSSVRLNELLSGIGLEGTVSDYQVSAPHLFNIFPGAEIGFSGGADAGVLYMTALQPFDTEEWLEVVIDGGTYHIIVTDDVTNGQKITEDYTDENGNSLIIINPDYAYGKEQYAGVLQGTDGTTYMQVAPLTNITLIQDKLKWEYAEARLSDGMEDNGFSIKDTDQNNLYFAAYDGSTTRLSTTDQYNVFSYNDTNGNQIPIATYTFPDAALLANGDDADVVVRYMALYLITAYPENARYYGNVRIGNGTDMHANVYPSSQYRFYRLGIEVDLEVYVANKNGNKVPGTFYFPMMGLTVRRTENEKGDSGWVKDFGLYNNDPHIGDPHNFNEGFIVRSGYTTHNGTIFYIPGGVDYMTDRTNANDKGYVCDIEKDGTQYYFYAANKIKSIGVSLNGSTYAGFETIVDSSQGLKGTYVAGVAITNNGTAQVDNKLLAGGTDAHRITSSTGTGGTIKTTSGDNNSASNPNGDLNDGTEILDSGTYTVPDGKSVIYTIAPRNDDYRLASVTVDRKDITLPTDVGSTQTVSLDGGKTGKLTYKGSGVYTFEFPENNADHDIHVHWEADHYFEKVWTNKNYEENSLTFYLTGYIFDGTSLDDKKTDQITVKKVELVDGETRIDNQDGSVTWKIKIPNDIYHLDIEALPSGHTSDYKLDHSEPLYWFAVENPVPNGNMVKYDNTGANASAQYDGNQLNALNTLLKGQSGAYLSIHDGDYGKVTNEKVFNLTITKTWEDNNNLLSKRPSAEEFLPALKFSYIYLDGTDHKTVAHDLGNFTCQENRCSVSKDPNVSIEITVNGKIWTIEVKNLPGRIEGLN